MVCEQFFSDGMLYAFRVLILVLMEDGLREFQSNWVWNQLQFVLILVLMEDGLRAFRGFDDQQEDIKSLNPCFNGRWSAS